MKKLSLWACLSLALILSFTIIVPIGTNASALSVGTAIVISSKCDVYQSPSFESNKLTDENDTVISLKHNDKVSVIEIVGDFAHIETADTLQGYVYKFYLTENSSQTIYPVFNASIRRETSLFDIDKIETVSKLKEGSRVYIYKGFVADKEGFIALQAVLEDGSLYNGYVKIEDVKPDGISSLLIVGISVIAAGVTIILSLVFIKKKKDKKKKKKN